MRVGLGTLSLLFLAFASVPSGADGNQPRSVHQELVGAAAPTSQLEQVESVESFGIRFYRFRQTVAGIPVLGAETIVTDARGRQADLLLDRSHARIKPPPQKLVTRAAAIAAARVEAGIKRLRSHALASLSILPQSTGGRLVWRVMLPAREPLASFEVLVDARTNAAVSIRDLLRRATGFASIFDPNPVVAQGSRAGLTDNGDADSPALIALRTPVTLERLNDADTCLAGQWVRATIPSGDACAPGRDFGAVTRADGRFEALMAYFHLDRAQAYIQTLGFTDVMNRQLRVRTNAFSDDNSFYDPVTGEISLGEGGTDDGEDAEVIDHEYGHAVQDDQVTGFGSSVQGQAMGEGFSDYFAASLARTFSSSSSFDPCVGEWDALGTGDPAPVPCLRRTDTELSAGQLGPGTACNAEQHCYGQAWSSALWTVREQIGATTADRLIIQSHFSIPSSGGFQEGARAILSADEQLYGGAHQELLRALFSSRGLLDLARLDDTPLEATPVEVPGSVSGHLDASGDVHDVYRLSLTENRGVIVGMNGSQGNFDVRLLRPGTVAINEPNAVLAGSTGPTANESFAHMPGASGIYFLDVSAVEGSGPYRLEVTSDLDGDTRGDRADNCPIVSNYGQEDRDGDGTGDPCDRFPEDAADDIDGDGLGADQDNCPRTANRDQADWDRDGRGDLCDRSARVTIRRLSLRGRRVRLQGSMRPPHLEADDWHVMMRRRVCRHRRCRYRRVGEVTRARSLGHGRVKMTFRLRPGHYRLHAVLRSTGYRSAASRPRIVHIKRVGAR